MLLLPKLVAFEAKSAQCAKAFRSEPVTLGGNFYVQLLFGKRSLCSLSVKRIQE